MRPSVTCLFPLFLSYRYHLHWIWNATFMLSASVYGWGWIFYFIYYKIMSKCFFFFSSWSWKLWLMIKTIYAIQNWSCMFMNEWLGIIGRLLYMIITIFCERAIPFVSFYRSLDFYWDQSCRKFLLFSQRVTHFHTLNKNYCMFHLRMILNWQLPIAVYKKNHFNW